MDIFLNMECMRLVINDQSIKFRYSHDFPSIEMNYLDITKLMMSFNSENSDVTE